MGNCWETFAGEAAVATTGRAPTGSVEFPAAPAALAEPAMHHSASQAVLGELAWPENLKQAEVVLWAALEGPVPQATKLDCQVWPRAAAR